MEEEESDEWWRHRRRHHGGRIERWRQWLTMETDLLVGDVWVIWVYGRLGDTGVLIGRQIDRDMFHQEAEQAR